MPGKAVVADPEALELNRLQLAWTDKSANATLGRQRIVLDDGRFVGSVGFRQNEQTFDAVRLGYTGSEAFNLQLSLIHIFRWRGPDRILGRKALPSECGIYLGAIHRSQRLRGLVRHE